MNNNSLEKFRQITAEIARKQERLKKALDKRPPLPQKGDIWIFDHPKTLGLRWVVLDTHQENSPTLSMGPADNNPMVGSTDIGVPDHALSGPLTLRCGYRFSMNKDQFNKGCLRIGLLDDWHLQHASDKIRQISERKVRSSVLQQETDHDPDYKEWMEQVNQGRDALKLTIPESSPVVSGMTVGISETQIAANVSGNSAHPESSVVSGMAAGIPETQIAANVSGNSAHPESSVVSGMRNDFPKHQNLYHRMKEAFAFLVSFWKDTKGSAPFGKNWALTGGGVVVLVVIVSVAFVLWFPRGHFTSEPGDNQLAGTRAPVVTNQNQIDAAYKIVVAQKTSEREETLRTLTFRWETPANVQGYSPPKPPSASAKAFGAGLLTGRAVLQGHSEVVLPPLLLPPAPAEDWLTTGEKDYFELGRWTVLLWAAFQFQDEMPQTFWEAQQPILVQFKTAFLARQGEDGEAERVGFKLKQIGQFLEKLPTDELAASKEFDKWKTMMISLAPPATSSTGSGAM